MNTKLFEGFSYMKGVGTWMSNDGQWAISKEEESYTLFPLSVKASNILYHSAEKVSGSVEDVINGLKHIAGYESSEQLDVSTGADRGRFYEDSTGNKIYISKSDIGLVEGLQGLSVELRIRILCLKEDEMEVFIKNRKDLNYNNLVSLFKKDWRDAAFGEPMNFNDAEYNKMEFGIELTKKEILKQAKARKLSIKEASQIFDFFNCRDKVYDQKKRKQNKITNNLKTEL
jgi:hypothetical protein